MTTRTRPVVSVLLVLAAIVLTACGSGAAKSSTAPPATSPCATTAVAPTRYDHVVVFAFENRTWSSIGGPGFVAMPYLRDLATHCTSFSDWRESDNTQNSGTQ